MPPRYSYWTILAGGLPTAFRAADRDELLPTFQRLREKHPDAELKWFARGRLWNSPDEARRAGDRHGGPAQGTGERRDRDWRPGGSHRDPRQKFVDAKKARNAKWRQERFDRRQRAEPPRLEENRFPPPQERSQQRSPQGGQGKRPDWQERPRDERQDWQRRDQRSENKGDRPRASGNPTWRERPSGKSGPFRERPPRPRDERAASSPDGRSADRRGPRDDRPKWNAPKGDRKPEWRDRERSKPGAFRNRSERPRDARGSSSQGFKPGDRPDRPRRDRAAWTDRPQSDRKPARRDKPRDDRQTRPPSDDGAQPRQDKRADWRKPPRDPRFEKNSNRDRMPAAKGSRPGDRQERRPFDRSGFERNQTNSNPPPPPKPRGPDREPRPSEDPRPSSPPRPDEPRIQPPGPPERGRRDRFRSR